jgi:hypothetical protein
MRLAEDEGDPPRLVGLRDECARWEADPLLAMRYLERTGELGPDPPPGPVTVEVVFASHTEKGDTSA